MMPPSILNSAKASSTSLAEKNVYFETMRPLRWAASIMPPSILNSAKASSTPRISVWYTCIEVYITTHHVKRSYTSLHFNSFTCRPGGRDCFSLSAFSLSVIFKVYRNREQRTLNFVFSAFFLILTLLASFLRAINRNCLISLISRGILHLL